MIDKNYAWRLSANIPEIPGGSGISAQYFSNSDWVVKNKQIFQLNQVGVTQNVSKMCKILQIYPENVEKYTNIPEKPAGCGIKCPEIQQNYTNIPRISQNTQKYLKYYLGGEICVMCQKYQTGVHILSRK